MWLGNHIYNMGRDLILEFCFFFWDYFLIFVFRGRCSTCGPCNAHSVAGAGLCRCGSAELVAGAGLCGPWCTDFVAGAGLFVDLEVQISWQV